MERIYYEIDEKQQKAAQRMWSFDEYKDGSTTADYMHCVDNVYNIIAEKIVNGIDEEKANSLYYFADRYARRLAKYYNDSARNELTCPSIMISGSGNFPVRKKEKQNARRDVLMQEYDEIQKIAQRIENASTTTSIIKMGDSNALEKLQLKIDRLKEEHAFYKGAAAHFRKHKTFKGYDTMTDEEAETLDCQLYEEYEKNNDFYRNHGWDNKIIETPKAYFNLSKYLQEIERLECRVREIERNKAIADNGGQQYDCEGICEVVEDGEDMRLRLIFDEKPDSSTIALLKRNGFKWSPKNTAWQRLLNYNSRVATQRVLDELRNA